jgi:hypothetical protein
VIEDLLADGPQRLGGEVEELAALELLGIDPVRGARELHRRIAELLHEPARVGLGRLEPRRLHHHHDVLELAEVLRVFVVPLHVAGVLGQDVAAGCLEAQALDGDGDAEDGEEEGKGHRQVRASARHPHEAAQQSTGARDGDHEVETVRPLECSTGAGKRLSLRQPGTIRRRR